MSAQLLRGPIRPAHPANGRASRHSHPCHHPAGRSIKRMSRGSSTFLGAPTVPLPSRKQSRLRVSEEESNTVVEIDQLDQLDDNLKPVNPETRGRLWSNVEPGTMRHQPGSVLGAVSLVAGTTVGAGILALPATTEPAGFAASAAALTGGAVYAMITALMLAEVNLNTLCDVGAGGVSIVTMASRTLGTTGTRLASGAYLFLHYCLLVAYFSRGGETIEGLLGLPLWAGSAMFAGTFGLLCYAASQQILDFVNNTLFLGVLVSFGVLTAGAIADIDVSALQKANWTALPATLPVISLAFVFQNVVPVIVSSLEGDIGKVRSAIVCGTLLPLGMFLAWEAAILGNPGALAGGADPVAALQASQPGLASVVDAFSFLAVATSTIGFVLGLSDFIADGMQLKAGRQQPLPVLLTLVPPYVLAMVFPGVFFKALDIAGTYGVLVLFGAMPAAMVWNERYGGVLPPAANIRVVPGGRITLLAVGGLAGAVIMNSFLASVSSSLP